MKSSIITIYDWLAISDKPEKSDVIFLFGGPRLGTPQKGLELYHQGFAPRIIATGNTGTFVDSGWGKPVADVFTEYLLSHSVPKDSILLQNKSMNTLEDVTLSLFLLEEKQIPLERAIIVSRPFHQRRCFGTFIKQAPSTHVMNVPADEIHPSALDNEDLLAAMGKRCMHEYERIVAYAEKGDIEKQDIPSEIEEAYQELKKHLKTFTVTKDY